MTTTAPSIIRAAIYARVPSEHQAQEQTIESQVAALRERVAADGLQLDEKLCFLDDGAIDRLVHHGVILELNITSYRLEQAKQAKAAASKGGE